MSNMSSFNVVGVNRDMFQQQLNCLDFFQFFFEIENVHALWSIQMTGNETALNQGKSNSVLSNSNSTS